jgi:hypothetical protein
MAIAWQSHGIQMAIAWQSHGNRMAIAWRSHGNLLDCYLIATLLLDYYLITT